MTKIIIFGCNGMLGKYMHTYFAEEIKPLYNVIPVSRNDYDVMYDSFEDLEKLLVNNKIDHNTVVLNCIGVIPQSKDKNNITDKMYIKVNSIFPHILATICDKYCARMIHFTTDCVFNGEIGHYDEKSQHDATSIYGISKSMGEPESCTVIRSSIIGEEIDNDYGLLEVVRNHRKKEMTGYTNHIWNGITCLQMAKIVDDIIKTNKFWKGVRHIISPESVSKYELIKLIDEVYGLKIKLTPQPHETYCNRELITIYDKDPIVVPPLETQLRDLYWFEINPENRVIHDYY